MDNYPYRLVVKQVGDNYSAYSPDVPGCVATGPTYEQTVLNIKDAIEFHIEGLVEDGLPVPEPHYRHEATAVEEVTIS